jgi:crotonobetainyl-CoA:carnitine CoA-transferase CaiB-like acyl-CoA transferase
MARLDAGQTGLSPEHRIYRCTGDWVAVAAIEPAEVKAFQDLTGADPEAFFAGRAAVDALALLTDAGVPNAPVRENQLESFFENPGHAAAGLHAHYRHARYGRMDQVGGFWNFGDLPLTLDRPPPALGEHTREVLLELGLAPQEIDGLIAGGLATAL